MVALNSIVLLCKQITILHFFLPVHSLLIIIVVFIIIYFLIINCQLSEKILISAMVIFFSESSKIVRHKII